MKIKVQIKNVYGVDRVYPLTYADELQALTGQKTLSDTHIKALKSIGFEIESIAPKL